MAIKRPDAAGTLAEHLARARARRSPLSRRLWAMSPEERVSAMWRRQLTLSQLREWTARAPHEVPLIGEELAWIAMHDPDWAEADSA